MNTWQELEHGPVVPQVEAMLRKRIGPHGWHPGQKVPSEATLAAEIGVGRSSVREAIRFLAHDGLLEVRHGSGTYVTDHEPPVAPVAELMRRARLIEVYEVRRSLEVEAARLAARRIGPQDLSDLRDLLDQRAALADDPARYVAVDLDFHEQIVALSGNSLLVELYRVARPIIHAAVTERISHDGPLLDTDRAHVDLVDALEAGDEAAAIAATESNLADTMTSLRPLEADADEDDR